MTDLQKRGIAIIRDAIQQVCDDQDECDTTECPFFCEGADCDCPGNTGEFLEEWLLNYDLQIVPVVQEKPNTDSYFLKWLNERTKAHEELDELKGRIENLDTGEDVINHPNHYNHGGLETLDLIRCLLTKEEYRGYLKGNVIKYRDRYQLKGKPEEDMGKCKKYMSWVWYEKSDE